MIIEVWRNIANPHVSVAQVIDETLDNLVAIRTYYGRWITTELNFASGYMNNRLTRGNESRQIEILAYTTVYSTPHETNGSRHMF